MFQVQAGCFTLQTQGYYQTYLKALRERASPVG